MTLVIETRGQVEPQYTGISLANLWGESLDFANHQASLNGFQAEVDDDGVLRFVVAHRDPGVPNWLDTAGHARGALALRWVGAKHVPKARTQVIPIASLS